MQYYQTEFVNERKIAVSVYENDQVLLKLAPGDKKYVESKDASTSYAPWSRIVFKEDGKVQLEENPAWKWPGDKDKLMLEIINVDGCDSELFYCGGEAVRCYKGIPRFVGISYEDTSWNIVKKLEIMFVEHIEKDGDFIARKKKLEQVRTLRSAHEIKEIKERILEDAQRRKKLELRIAFTRRER